MSVTVDQIIKLYVAGLLSGTGTQGDPIILDDLPANTVIGDLGGGTGAITLDQLKAAMNVGAGNAGVRPLNVIVSDGSDLIDLDQWAFDYWQIDLNAVSATTLSITDPLTSAVPLIHLHFINMIGDVDVTFPNEMKDANGDALGTHTFSQGQIVPFYYAGGNYYTNYLNVSGSGGSGSIVQDGTGIAISDTTGGVTTLASLIAGAGISIVRTNDTITFSATAAPNESEYAAILTYAGTQGYTGPDAATQTLQNQMVYSLKAANLWDKLEVLYVFTHDQALDEFSLINWKDPSLFELTAVDAGALTWSALGVRGGLGDYLDTGFNLADDLAVASTTSISMAFAVAQDDIAGAVAGARNGGAYQFDISTSSGIVKGNILAGTATPAADDLAAPPNGYDNQVIQWTLTGLTKSVYRGGSLSGSATVTDSRTTLSTHPVHIIGRNEGGTHASQFPNADIRFLAIGDHFDGTEAANFASILETYLSGL